MSEGVGILIGAVLAASLLGSLHCAGMCGAFLLFAVGTDRQPTRAERLRLHAAYHGGRLVTYSALGAVAGAVGAALDFGGSFVGVQRVAAALAGAMMIGFGLVTLSKVAGVRARVDLIPRAWRSRIEKVQQRAFDLPPFTRALSIGLLTTLLPCGWLYAFAFTAAGTGHPALGALTMAVFWLGTLPVLASVGLAAQSLAGPLRRHLPVVTSLLLVVVGVFMVAQRVGAPIMDRESLGLTPTAASGAGSVPTPGEVDCPLCHPGDG
ncbi:MAG: sulfite exporter TauE/SafE family protein [Phycisphaerales bacterium]